MLVSVAFDHEIVSQRIEYLLSIAEHNEGLLERLAGHRSSLDFLSQNWKQVARMEQIMQLDCFNIVPASACLSQHQAHADIIQDSRFYLWLSDQIGVRALILEHVYSRFHNLHNLIFQPSRNIAMLKYLLQ